MVHPADNREVVRSNRIGPITILILIKSITILIIFYYLACNHLSMDRNQKLILVIGIFILVGLLLKDIYLALIGVIILIVLWMSFRIMANSAILPNVAVSLRDDAKGIVVTNKGNAEALNIHIALVPLNKEYDLPSMQVDEQQEFPSSTMIEEAKAVVTYEDAAGRKYSRSYGLSALGGGEEDLLRPAFPIFGWK